ncbi:hypothetical protein IEQ34_017907 [Dendrobium chrysotoxum]|uniref:Uncharacterized protein n=1 Tax=Dendrobium chrysotoxum TaxID=161865 RepID=A0AAV7GCX5_DENCH|nr:hypothetical protein IEQ34_017907 [Dendrobium chrysotoxum]
MIDSSFKPTVENDDDGTTWEQPIDLYSSSGKRKLDQIIFKDEILITNPYHSFMKMDLQNTPMTVQLGQGSRIQLVNAIIEMGKAGATIQFGSLDFPAVIARTAAVPMNGMESGGPSKRPHSTKASIHHIGLPASGKNNVEASSSGGWLTRRLRRKMNAEIQAQQQQLPIHASNLPTQEPEATIFDLKWVHKPKIDQKK